MTVVSALLIVLAPTQGNALGEEEPGQCAVCQDGDRPHVVCDDVWPYDCWWAVSEHHRLGRDEQIVNTFAGDGVHSSWALGSCMDVHGECGGANLAFDIPEATMGLAVLRPLAARDLADVINHARDDPAALNVIMAALDRSRVAVNIERRAIQLLECAGGVYAHIPVSLATLNGLSL